jgi:hypothetical protein
MDFVLIKEGEIQSLRKYEYGSDLRYLRSGMPQE